MAGRYHRPLVFFYLKKPPLKGDRGQDFRRLPNSQDSLLDPVLDTLIRDIRARHNLVKSLLEDEEAEPLPFIGKFTMNDRIDQIASSIMNTIEFNLDYFRRERNFEEAFKYLRRQVEKVGIFVLLMGDLGSHHSKISVSVFRGFSIADEIAPFIVVNEHDAKSARSFTLLHEVVHLWLGTTGISGSSLENQIEKYCNDVAGEILLPTNDLISLESIRNLTVDEAVSKIGEFAQVRRISRSMVIYKLVRRGLVDERFWRSIENKLGEDRPSEKTETKNDNSGGPNYYVVRRHRLGEALLNLVNRSINSGSLSPTKAAAILGIRPGNVRTLLEDFSPRGL